MYHWMSFACEREDCETKHFQSLAALASIASKTHTEAASKLTALDKHTLSRWAGASAGIPRAGSYIKDRFQPATAQPASCTSEWGAGRFQELFMLSRDPF